jgi:hypothetical protein
MIDFKELFAKDQRIRAVYLGVELVHHLRGPTDAEDLEFRRRSSEMRMQAGELRSTDRALNANIWFYNTITEKVTAAEDPDGSEQEVENFKETIPADLKLAVVHAYLNRFTVSSTRVKPNEPQEGDK